MSEMEARRKGDPLIDFEKAMEKPKKGSCNHVRGVWDDLEGVES